MVILRSRNEIRKSATDIVKRDWIHICLSMSNKSNEIIMKSQKLLMRLEKIGASEGGMPVEHQTGPFGTRDYAQGSDDDSDLIPEDIDNEQGFRRSDLAIEAEPDGVQKSESAAETTINGGFGYTDEKIADDNFYMPEDIQSEDGCTYEGDKCIRQHPTKRTTRQAYGTGLTAQAQI